ncbi:uncharacterized protein RAG0_03333 [Rhynchosporium agropyri]|uniref:Protein kinase domain-containing protein n=1 Tax=Rhynchosporium agropyri TaxID=914238 RepID=A0A1E1K4C0_9HELO|nr:uncharacterized protein RAG0_03333 [Rhynchosporium agropyri]
MVTIQILDQEVDCDGTSPSFYREMEQTISFFAKTSREEYASFQPLWHADSHNYLSFEIGPRLRSNVYVASSPDFDQSVDAKFARFAREIGYYNAEMQAYSWLEGHEIGPKFLGYLTEEGRVMGFLPENIEGRRAAIGDLSACKSIPRKLHALGLIHRDVNKHNFLITEHGPVLIDFVTAEKSNDTKAMEVKLEGLEKQFLDELGIGSKEVEEGNTHA